jgi:pre-mRNA-splicing factor ATP-dependent RNA helicase DHX15/PRP43
MPPDRSQYDGDAPAKRQKTLNGHTDPRKNPYLQHMYSDETERDECNRHHKPPSQLNGASSLGPLAGLKRHQTNAKLAQKAEDGQENPFTGESFSSRYVSILRTRRGLPVHAQRWFL